MQSRSIRIRRTGDGYIVTRTLTEREPGHYARDDSEHPVASEEEVQNHLSWLRPPAEEPVQLRRHRRTRAVEDGS